MGILLGMLKIFGAFIGLYLLIKGAKGISDERSLDIATRIIGLVIFLWIVW